MEGICWSTGMFGTSDDYHELNAGAHRKCPKNLYAPALTWHLAFWINTPFASQETNAGIFLHDLKRKLDAFLLTLCRSLKADKIDVHLSPCVSSNLLLFNTVAHEALFVEVLGPPTQRQDDILKSGSRAVSVKFKWHLLNITIRCEMHTEYFSITTFAEIDKSSTSPPFSTLKELNKKIRTALAYFNAQKPGIAHSLNKYFFGGFWTAYWNYILAHREVADLIGDNGDNIFKYVFADFRGIVLSEKAVELPIDNKFFDGNEPPSWGGAARKKFFPLLNARNIESQRQYECSVSYMLDGRAIYMSALAPQLPDSPDEERIPLEFILYVHQHVPNNAKRGSVNKWELGRLLNQLQHLGNLRLAALKDVKLLHNAGKDLSGLELVNQKARGSVVAPNARDAMELIQKAHEHFNSITTKFSNNADCGLLYRIERSRYYVAQFRSNVKFLRIKRFEGYQPYDQFVERRLGAEFDFIDRLGV